MKIKAPRKLTKKVANSASVRIGSPLPNLSLPSTGGGTLALQELKGQILVLYFYPRDATPGCTLEGQDFSRLYSSFRKCGAEVLGISRDTIQSHEKFKAKQNYKINLLSDADEKACKAFDVIKMKNMYGKKVRGIERSTFVVDRKGLVVQEWRGVKVAGHAEEVLAFVKAL